VVQKGRKDGAMRVLELLYELKKSLSLSNKLLIIAQVNFNLKLDIMIKPAYDAFVKKKDTMDVID